MRVRLLAFATARQALGGDEIELEIEAGSTLADLSERLRTEYPALDTIWPRLAIAVDGELTSSETSLKEGSEVALLPPVSGGSAGPRAWLVDEPIDIDLLVRTAAHPTCGAVLVFVGDVRETHQDRQVARITYDAYRSMALQRLESIAAELEAATSGLRVRIAHRLGDVPVGETSVVIAAASPHRAAAYEANRSALERLKREVPIWKREHYTDGQQRWREEEPLG